LTVAPVDAYRALCTAVGGQYVRRASSSAPRLSPFGFAPTPPDDREGRDALREQVAALVSLLDLMLAEPGQPLGAAEKAVLDEAIREVYDRAGATARTGASGDGAPLMRDLHRALADTPGELAR